MTDTLPSIRFGRVQGQLAAITEAAQYNDLSALKAAMPSLEAPENAQVLAQALNHFDPKGHNYTVISHLCR